MGADLAYPGVAGRRTAQIRMVNSYLPRLHAAATTDPALALAFVRVLGLLDRPESLLRPDRLLRVALARPQKASPPQVPTRPARHPVPSAAERAAS